MQAIRTLFFTLFITGATIGHSLPMSFGMEPTYDIVVNNRVLTMVNQKPITVLDVAKKMDMAFFSQYPEYADSPQARYQYYQARWKADLNELIEKELILADASEHKIDITRGDIRQELEETFGPNVIENLDRAGLTLDEALEMTKDNITIRRILGSKVNAKAVRRAIPDNLKKAYEEYVAKNAKPEKWNYRVISVRSPEEAKGAEIAQSVYESIQEEALELAQLQERYQDDEEVQITVSELYSHTKDEIGSKYKEALEKLAAGQFSEPVAQKGRKDNRLVYRIFYLADVDQGGAPPFNEVTPLLRKKIMEEAIEEETISYLNNLHKHFAISNQEVLQQLPENFQPFSLQRVN